jgi:phosphoserine aminotransferase
VFRWIKELGGLTAMNAINEKKAALLYDYLDQSRLFKGTVEKNSRSIMNVPFITGDAELDKAFIADCQAAGIRNIKGHRSVGGMRASIYNAMPIEGVQALLDVMEQFEKAHA